MQFRPLRFKSIQGLTSYEEAREMQKKLVELRANDEIEDTVLFLEHAPVITQGRGLQKTSETRPGDSRHAPLPQNLPEGISFSETERGGDLTYHGPGQLVVYPIFKLDGSSSFCSAHDIDAYLRSLESVFIDVLSEFGLQAKIRPEATGVWVGDRKVASIGIAVRKWVTYHGVAINVVNDLKPFHLISPCGFSPEVMTRLSDLIPQFESREDWRAFLEKRIARGFARKAQADLQTGSYQLVSGLAAAPKGSSSIWQAIN